MLFQTRQGLTHTHPNTQMTQAPRPQVVQRQSTGELGRAGESCGQVPVGSAGTALGPGVGGDGIGESGRGHVAGSGR